MRGRLYRFATVYVVANLKKRVCSDELSDRELLQLKRGEIKPSQITMSYYLEGSLSGYNPVNVKAI